MGYTTEFKGELKFTRELTGKELAVIKNMSGEDCRDHPEWDADGLYYIDLELTDDFSGIQWNGTEKTYSMEKLVNVVIKEMQKIAPGFGLEGMFSAQGQDPTDRWVLLIEDGWAVKKETPVTGTIIICPECGSHVITADAEMVQE